MCLHIGRLRSRNTAVPVITGSVSLERVYNVTNCANEFKLQPCKWKDYKGTCFYGGERPLIKRWLNRVYEMPRVSHVCDQ